MDTNISHPLFISGDGALYRLASVWTSPYANLGIGPIGHNPGYRRPRDLKVLLSHVRNKGVHVLTTWLRLFDEFGLPRAHDVRFG